MKYHYNNLDELRSKKALLKKDIEELEDIITFENTKESLGVLTNGFTDKFLVDKVSDNGSHSVGIKTSKIVHEISNEMRNKIVNKNAILGFISSETGSAIAENALKLGVTTLVGNFARKNLNNSSWKKKILGLALIYVAPMALRYVRKNLESYQKNKSIKSLEQLI